MRYLLTVSVFAVVFGSAGAYADARQHFLAGQDYYTQGRYEKAIEEFQEAYRLDPRPLLLFNLAQAYEKLGKLEETVDYLKRYLKEDPQTDQRKSLLNKIDILTARIAGTGITVKANEPGATVYVDESKVGETPMDGVINLKEGTHKIRILKNGFSDFVMNVAISAGQNVPVEAVLEPGQAGPPPGPAVAGGQGETPSETGSPAETKVDEGEREGGVSALDVVPWVIAGTGAAAAIVGFGVLGAMAVSKDDHDLAVVADYVGWPGVALAVGGTAWGLYNILSDKSSDKDESSVAVIPYIDRSGAHMSAAVRF